MSLEDVCRPGPVFHPPPWADSSSGVRDGFDHREPGQRAPTLPGEDTDLGGKEMGNGEEEEEFQARHYSDDSVMSEMANLERILPVNGSPMPLAMGFAPPPVSEDCTERNEWQCDYPSCGRQFRKRHDLK